MFYWAAKNSIFSGDKWRFDKIDPHCSVALSKSSVILLIYCILKTNLIAKSNYYTWGVCLRESINERKVPIFIFKSVRIRLRESVRLQECVNTEIDWELKRGLEKASVRRAVRLREGPLAES